MHASPGSLDGPRDEWGDRPPDSERSSLPWQERGSYSSSLSAMAQTIKVVLFSPSQAFSYLRLENSIAESLVFVLVLGSAGALIANLWQFLLQAQDLAAFSGPSSPHAQMVQEMGMAVSIIFTAVLTPFFVTIASFIQAGILHLCLIMTGGANRTFAATYAVVAYAWGSTALFLVFPMCGGLVSFVWRLIAEILGLAAAHETDTWRALVAELLPLAFCCGAFVILLWLLFLPALAGLYGA